MITFFVHFLSAGSVGFARGLNDTLKIVWVLTLPIAAILSAAIYAVVS